MSDWTRALRRVWLENSVIPHSSRPLPCFSSPPPNATYWWCLEFWKIRPQRDGVIAVKATPKTVAGIHCTTYINWKDTLKTLRIITLTDMTRKKQGIGHYQMFKSFPTQQTRAEILASLLGVAWQIKTKSTMIPTIWNQSLKLEIGVCDYHTLHKFLWNLSTHTADFFWFSATPLQSCRLQVGAKIWAKVVLCIWVLTL